jgi:hypothetical protein
MSEAKMMDLFQQDLLLQELIFWIEESLETKVLGLSLLRPLKK